MRPSVKWTLPLLFLHFLPSSAPLCFLVPASRGETLRMSSLWSTLTGLLRHDQAPADSRRGSSLPVHCVLGVLQQPGHHAETHQKPCSAGLPPWLEHQQHLPVHLTHLSHTSQHSDLHLHKVLISVASVCAFHLLSLHLSHKAAIFLKENAIRLSERPRRPFNNTYHSLECMVIQEMHKLHSNNLTCKLRLLCIHIHKKRSENCGTNFQLYIRKGFESVYHFTLCHVRALKPHQQFNEWRRNLPSYFHNYCTTCKLCKFDLGL